ncbi:hypothetical protein CS063_17055 [Sporanaerobium hydrogeniformans]|uniref:Uncharacterized protein n=1 Tax=Sporanaerobium hydrogeniformans TaxID=3072179 RepID=A0AC61D8P3_9FIRM|nr:DUF2232 domain-containing protein [Sporanaerobium hydrogeniformans]PHV69215.1 hypothetical protein CS063_17055 [Sporanaerobium hydrogeniformans]
MQLSSKNMMKLLSILLIYIVLASLGTYEFYGLFLFPLLSVPFTICLIKNTLPKGVDFLFCSTAVIGIYMIVGNIEAVLVFLIAVCIPAYVIAFSYRKGISLPHIIIYLATGVIGAIFIYGILMTYLGRDYGTAFIHAIDEVKQIYFDAIEKVKETVPAESINQLGDIKGTISMLLDLMKQVYPAFLLVIGVVLATINLLIVQLVLRLKKAKAFKLEQLLTFKLSKIVVVILILAMLLSIAPSMEGDRLTIVAANIIVFLQNILQLVGTLAIISIISKGSMNKGVKWVLYILVCILFIIYPSMLTMFGCFDTIFNYRKTDIIV